MAGEPRNIQVEQMLAAKLDELLKASPSATVRIKLSNLDDVCRHLVMNGRQRLSVPSVVAAYAARIHSADQSIAESSIRNKRAGRNPFQQLYRAWESAAEVMTRSRTRRSPRSTLNEIIGDGEISAISDGVLRHQVALLLAQNRSYKSQLDILKQVRGSPTIKLVGRPENTDYRPLHSELSLNEAEIESVKDFLSGRKLKTLGFKRTMDGGIATNDGRRLADPSFMDALDKILKSYTDPSGTLDGGTP